MTTLLQFLSIYGIPVFSGFISIATYAHAYGKPYDQTFASLTFGVIIAGLIGSCVLALSMIGKFVANDIRYFAILFTVLPCLIQAGVISLYYIMLKEAL
ncbi:hypothetical protein [Marinicellulosiphila megalodicopiae]|uniref:hypothetical protein n=1 Tax=Marinicellulosiphila megalodicopiae TaxID=2724896 RepID=UPI003BAED645